MVWFFGIVMAVGLLYLLLVIVGGLGDLFDLDGTLESMGIGSVFGIDASAVAEGVDALDDLGSVTDAGDSLDATGVAGELQGVGCLTISAFMAVFGAIGMVGILNGRNLPITILIGLVISYAVARLITELLKYVYRQQSNSAYSTDSLIGMTAQATINAEGGKTGEVLVEAGGRVKYPVREINGNALKRGDQVTIVGIDGRYLQVEKANG